MDMQLELLREWGWQPNENVSSLFLMYAHSKLKKDQQGGASAASAAVRNFSSAGR